MSSASTNAQRATVTRDSPVRILRKSETGKSSTIARISNKGTSKEVLAIPGRVPAGATQAEGVTSYSPVTPDSVASPSFCTSTTASEGALSEETGTAKAAPVTTKAKTKGKAKKKAAPIPASHPTGDAAPSPAGASPESVNQQAPAPAAKAALSPASCTTDVAAPSPGPNIVTSEDQEGAALAPTPKAKAKSKTKVKKKITKLASADEEPSSPQVASSHPEVVNEKAITVSSPPEEEPVKEYSRQIRTSEGRNSAQRSSITLVSEKKSMASDMDSAKSLPSASELISAQRSSISGRMTVLMQMREDQRKKIADIKAAVAKAKESVEVQKKTFGPDEVFPPCGIRATKSFHQGEGQKNTMTVHTDDVLEVLDEQSGWTYAKNIYPDGTFKIGWVPSWTVPKQQKPPQQKPDMTTQIHPNQLNRQMTKVFEALEEGQNQQESQNPSQVGPLVKRNTGLSRSRSMAGKDDVDIQPYTGVECSMTSIAEGSEEEEEMGQQTGRLRAMSLASSIRGRLVRANCEYPARYATELELLPQDLIEVWYIFGAWVFGRKVCSIKGNDSACGWVQFWALDPPETRTKPVLRWTLTV